MSRNLLVIPCFNEARRLRLEPLSDLIQDVPVLFVDDGSTDSTAKILAEFCQEAGPHRAALLKLASNVGKGEAVRQGMRHAIEIGATLTGYADADLSTPVSELARLVACARKESGPDVVLASRVAFLGTDIERTRSRHYLGRVFATAASMVLGVRVYDTQCGAKLFHVDDRLRDVLSREFVSRWAFDVELIGRLLNRGAHVIEVPLRQWRDVPGSKLNLTSMVRAGGELASIAIALRRYR